MQFTFSDALRQLGPDAAFRLINGARTPNSYLFSQILPERMVPDYKVESGSMTIRPLMAGLVGMDSAYPEQTAIESSTFLEQSAKVANRVRLPEAALRRLHAFMQQIQMTGGNSNEAVVQQVLNFSNALLIQPQIDTAEWMRGQALLGAIDWTFNQKRVQVDYGIPSPNKPAQRTSTAGYGGSASKFWDDDRLAKKLLRGQRRAVIMHSDTYDMAISNAANNARVLAATNIAPGVNRYSLVKMIQQNGMNTESSDARDRTDIITYDLEGETLDPANPTGPTLKIPFIKPGKVMHIGANAQPGYMVGAGSQVPGTTNNAIELGYTHIAPTVEGGGQMGRWARVFTPEGQPWSLQGESVANELPVIDRPDLLVVFDTVMV